MSRFETRAQFFERSLQVGEETFCRKVMVSTMSRLPAVCASPATDRDAERLERRLDGLCPAMYSGMILGVDLDRVSCSMLFTAAEGRCCTLICVKSKALIHKFSFRPVCKQRTAWQYI